MRSSKFVFKHLWTLHLGMLYFMVKTEERVFNEGKVIIQKKIFEKMHPWDTGLLKDSDLTI